MQRGKKVKKKKTTVIRNSGGHPTWNEALTFSVPRNQLRESGLMDIYNILYKLNLNYCRSTIYTRMH